MDIWLLVAFFGVSFSLVMTPGADWAYAISAGLRERALVPALSGMLLGYLTITIVVAAGVGALVASVPKLLVVLTLAGSAYLLWVGVNVLLRPPIASAGDEQEGRWMGWLVRGFGVSGFNPKALLLFLALLPQFTSRTAHWPIAGQITTMGLLHIVNCAIVYSLVGIGAKMVLRTRPVVARRVSQVSGVAMIVIALLLVAEQSMTWGGRLSP